MTNILNDINLDKAIDNSRIKLKNIRSRACLLLGTSAFTGLISLSTTNANVRNIVGCLAVTGLVATTACAVKCDLRSRVLDKLICTKIHGKDICRKVFGSEAIIT